MGTAVTITQTDHLAADLRAFAAKCPDAAQSRRLLAIAMVLDGSSRLEAARQTGMDRPAGISAVASSNNLTTSS